jgi:hypothetical protein
VNETKWQTSHRIREPKIDGIMVGEGHSLLTDDLNFFHFRVSHNVISGAKICRSPSQSVVGGFDYFRYAGQSALTPLKGSPPCFHFVSILPFAIVGVGRYESCDICGLFVPYWDYHFDLVFWYTHPLSKVDNLAVRTKTIESWSTLSYSKWRTFPF